jgi:signal peptidase II
MRPGTRLFLLTALAVVLLDQLSKWLVVQSLPVGMPMPGPDTLVGRYFSLTHVHNTGVAFGLGRGNNALFTLVALAVTAGIVVYQRGLPEGDRWPRIALGLVAGGAVGNLIDRFRQGYVTDFLDFKFWPVFNVADSCVVIGVLLLAWYLWRQERAGAPKGEASAAAPPVGGAE